ncbi:MAG: hypothetical protein AAB348_02650 [Patescibacteria group bacterium]
MNIQKKPLIVLTRSLKGVKRFRPGLFLLTIKKCAKFLLGQNRGPQMVTESLLTGLRGLKIKYLLNPKIKNIERDTIVYVNESVEALRDAIELKMKGVVSKIVAGPVLVILPKDENAIMLDPNIDLFLVPSAWTKNLWISLAPALAEKIKIWPAGVDSDCDLSQKRDMFLVYYKSGPKHNLII